MLAVIVTVPVAKLEEFTKGADEELVITVVSLDTIEGLLELAAELLDRVFRLLEEVINELELTEDELVDESDVVDREDFSVEPLLVESVLLGALVVIVPVLDDELVAMVDDEPETLLKGVVEELEKLLLVAVEKMELTNDELLAIELIDAVAEAEVNVDVKEDGNDVELAKLEMMRHDVVAVKMSVNVVVEVYVVVCRY
ncbi:hypothetical protein ACN47E_002105 [Coniothyrium glycines]